MFFLTETEETISPESEAMPLWKKYLTRTALGVSRTCGGDAADGGSCMPILAHVPEASGAGGTPGRGSRAELHEALRHLAQGALALLHALDEPDAERSFCSTYWRARPRGAGASGRGR